jgi:hypothetical protein
MKYAEIASDYENWSEYSDTDPKLSKAEFDALPMEKRLALLTAKFGQEGKEHC